MFGQWEGLCLGPTGLEKALGAGGRRDPGVSPTSGLRGRRTSPGSTASFLDSSGWGKCPPLLSCSSGPGGPLPSASPDLPSLPHMPPGPTQPGGGFGGGGTSLGAQQAPQAQVGGAIALHSSPVSPRGPLPPASPDLPGLRGTGPVWPPLLLHSQFLHVLLVHLGVPRISLGVRVPHQQPAGAIVLGRR